VSEETPSTLEGEGNGGGADADATSALGSMARNPDGAAAKPMSGVHAVALVHNVIPVQHHALIWYI